MLLLLFSFFFFFNDTATTEIYTLSLHDALPISGPSAAAIRAAAGAGRARRSAPGSWRCGPGAGRAGRDRNTCGSRSEEHTSELQSRPHLVCRLLLEKKKSKGHNIS